jgi:integrase
MARRRSNNEGCIYQRKDGLWCAQVSLDGKRLTKYGKTQKECRTWITETLGKIENGLTYEGTQVTLEQFVESWLEGKELSRRLHTVLQYRQIVQQHILPHLGKMRLQDIQPAHVKQLYFRKRGEGRGDRTVQLIHTVLNNVLKQAVREGLLGHNPVDAVDRPNVEQTEHPILSEEQARQLVIASMNTRNGMLYYLALITGMREGELLGLKWSDLDWDKGILFIQRQSQRAPGQGLVLVPPKTRSGRRQIKLAQATQDRLTAHRDQLSKIKDAAGDRWQENDLIFPNSLGKLKSCENLHREYKRFLKENRLPDIRFHDLRHTSLTLLLEMGTPINTVQQRAGHSKASITTDTYGHSMTRSQDEAAQKIEEMINPVPIELQ